jgi:hypothetical protein
MSARPVRDRQSALRQMPPLRLLSERGDGTASVALQDLN